MKKVILILFILTTYISCGSSKEPQFSSSTNKNNSKSRDIASANKGENSEENKEAADKESKVANYITNEYCQLEFGANNLKVYIKEGGLSESDPEKFMLTYWGVNKQHYKVEDAEFEIIKLDEFNVSNSSKTIGGSNGPQEITNKVTHYAAKIHIKTTKAVLVPADTGNSIPKKEFMYISMCSSIEKL